MSAVGISPEAADIVVLNTCHIREKAAEKLYSDIGRLRKPRADGSAVRTIVAAGCVAQAEGAEIGRRAPAVDVIVGPLAYHRLPELLREAAAIPEDARGARWGRAHRYRHAGGAQVCRAAAAPPPGRQRVPDRAGRLRQILHLLRRALYTR